MAEIKDLAHAKKTFETLCNFLDGDDWRYKKDEEDMSIECGVQGDDFSMELSVRVDPDRMLIRLLSHLPFIIQEDKRFDVAIAISAVNDRLVAGCFEFDISSGHIFYRMTNSFIESDISESVFDYMMYFSSHVIDEYNDKFLMIGKGMISVEQFIAMLTE